jgi:hypothetical protein
MTDGIAHTTSELLDELDKRAVQTLHSHSLYSPSVVGWLNEHDPDPDFVGYAMWATDAPSYTSTDEWGMPSYSELDELTKAKTLAGEDFEAFLELAWHGIGLTLLYAEHRAHPISSQQDITWYHLASSFIALTVASDRIRDLFVLSAFGLPLGAYRGGARGAYPLPFREYASSIASGGSEALVTLNQRLLEHALIIEPMRRYRNKLVHEIASDSARTVRELMERPAGERRELSHEEMLEFLRSAPPVPSHNAEINELVEDIKQMYASLIRMGSDAFEFELRLRRPEREI